MEIIEKPPNLNWEYKKPGPAVSTIFKKYKSIR